MDGKKANQSLAEWYAMAQQATKDYFSTLEGTLSDTAMNPVAFQQYLTDINTQIRKQKIDADSAYNKKIRTDYMHHSNYSNEVDESMVPKDVNKVLHHKKAKAIAHMDADIDKPKMSNCDLSPDVIRLPPDTEIIKYISSNPDKSTHSSIIPGKRSRLDSDDYRKTDGKSFKNLHLRNKIDDDNALNFSTSHMESSAENNAMEEYVNIEPLNLSLKTTSDRTSEDMKHGYNSQDCNSSSSSYDLKSNYKEGRPRNLGRGISKPKKNTVASLLAQSRAYSIKSHQNLSSMDVNSQATVDITSNTDTESVCESGFSESDSEMEHCNVEDLQIPLESGWQRETNVKGISKSGNIKGEVCYYAPDSEKKIKNHQQLQEILGKMQTRLSKDNFSFSTKHIVGHYVQTMSDGEFIKMNDYEMVKVLEDINKKLNDNSIAEQRMDIAKQQQTWRELSKYNIEDLTIFKENAYLHDLNKQKEILYALELERERRNQLIMFINQFRNYKHSEIAEKKLHQEIFEKLASREKLLESQKGDSKILVELRKPQEDLTIKNQKEFPSLERINGLMLHDQEFADLLMVFQFICNFGDSLGFELDMSQFTLDNLHSALVDSSDTDAEEELLSVLVHLVSSVIEDPGIPNPNRHTTLLGQTLKQADITTQNVSEILRIYLYAMTISEIKQQNIDHDFSDLHQLENNDDFSQNHELLQTNQRYELSECLRDNPFAVLSAKKKLKILTTLCEDLLQNKSVCHQIELNLELQAQLKKERFLLENKLRKYKNFLSRKIRNELEKNKANAENADMEMEEVDANNDKKFMNDRSICSQNLSVTDTSIIVDKMEYDNSDLESESTLFDEEEDTNLSVEDIKKKTERIKEQAIQVEKNLDQALNSLRAISLGFDRYFRNYWLFPKSGVIFVESMTTTKPEMFEFGQQFKKEIDVTIEQPENHQNDDNVQTKSEEKSIKDHLDVSKEQESFDIEESIPTAILVQKENKSNDSRFVEINHVVPNNGITTNDEDISKTTNTENGISEKGNIKEIENNKFNSNNWFSLLNCEENENSQMKFKCEGNISQCKNVKYMVGLTWEIQNNLNYDSEDLNKTSSGTNNFEGHSTSDENQLCEKAFTLPSYLRKSVHEIEAFLQNDCITPLQITQEEQKMLNEIKTNGFLKEDCLKNIPTDYQTGWWQISEHAKFNDIISCLNVKGIREKNLRQNLLSISDNFEFGFHSNWLINDNKKDSKSLTDDSEKINMEVYKRIEKTLIDKIELIEDKIASASMQVKGWVVPDRDMSGNDIIITLIRDRILSLENAIEKRYLKPPLGNNSAEAQLAAIALEAQEHPPSNSNSQSTDKNAVSKGLSTWREAVQKSISIAQLSMAIDMLEQCIAWDKSIMKANCQFCQSGENEDKLLLCDGCDRGYHTYCFKPKMDNIPDGDWFCFECLNKATGEKKCIVCGGRRNNPVGKLIHCELCPRIYHHDCYVPVLLKIPRGKWYCKNCVTSAPPRKKAQRKSKENKIQTPQTTIISQNDELSNSSPGSSKTEKNPQNNQKNIQEDKMSNLTDDTESKDYIPSDDCSPSISQSIPLDGKKEEQKKKAVKKAVKDFSVCKIILEELEVHEDSWPFLLPVNTKQFPTYKKVIKHPMDISTIKKRLSDQTYKSHDEFVNDVRLIFDNCEKFNYTNSPVGQAGHGMRKYFELRWAELTNK